MLVQLYRISLEDSLEAVRHSAEVRNDVKITRVQVRWFRLLRWTKLCVEKPTLMVRIRFHGDDSSSRAPLPSDSLPDVFRCGRQKIAQACLLLRPPPTPPLASVNHRAEQDGRRLELRLLSGRQVYSWLFQFCGSDFRGGLWRFIWCRAVVKLSPFAWTLPLCVCVLTPSCSVCCQSTGGQCRDQAHHPRGEDIYIRADERDFPKRLWTFDKTLR